MKFYNIKEKKPEIGQKCLIKCVGKSYACIVTYVQAAPSGRRLFTDDAWEWYDKDIVGWMPIEELDKIEVEEWSSLEIFDFFVKF